MKSLIKILAIFTVVSLLPLSVKAEDEHEKFNLYIFHGETCPHCQELLEWLDKNEEKYGYMYNIVKYEVWNDSNNAALMNSVSTALEEEAGGVPYIVIGDKTMSGFAEGSTDEELVNMMKEEYNKDVKDRVDVVANTIKETNWKPSSGDNNNTNESKKDSKSSDLFIGLALVVVIVGGVAIAIKARQ